MAMVITLDQTLKSKQLKLPGGQCYSIDPKWYIKMEQVFPMIRENMGFRSMCLMPELGSTPRLVMWQVCDQLPLRNLNSETKRTFLRERSSHKSRKFAGEEKVIPMGEG